MKRRGLLQGGFGCALCALAGGALAADEPWQKPPRFARPELASDEGGLWALMDREETRLKRSPFVLRDAELTAYVQGIACKLAAEHCPDVRVYLVRTPLFNASMAPNGMMQVWTGLMLRVDNEAQLAAILGHEIGHYLARHSLDRLRDAKSRSAFGTFLSLFGAVGALGQLGVLAGMFAYSRDHERQADSIGLDLMKSAGYAPIEASRVWGNLLLEIKARAGPNSSPMFATHPQPEERMETLKKLAETAPEGEAREDAWRAQTARHRLDWLEQEIKRGQHEESLALLNRMASRTPAEPEVLFARGELMRLRGAESDFDAALADYRAAIALGREPAASHRGIGLILRRRGETAAARESLARYIELAPRAADAAMMRTYIEEMEK